jgi:hypothetical protein
LPHRQQVVTIGGGQQPLVIHRAQVTLILSGFAPKRPSITLSASIKIESVRQSGCFEIVLVLINFSDILVYRGGNLFEIFSGIGVHEFGDQMRDEVARNEADSKEYDIEAEVRNAPGEGVPL